MRILSIDIGTHSIKLIELDARFGRLDLIDYLLEPVQEEPIQTSDITETEVQKVPQTKILSEGQISAIRRIAIDHPLKYDRLTVGLPLGLITTRVFSFPTKDRKTIQKSISFELEDEVPVSLNDSIFDFAQLQTQGNSTTVLSAVTLKKNLIALLSELQLLGLDPDMVTTEGWATGQLLHKCVPGDYAGTPICIVNLGAKFTSFQMLVNENPILSHSVQIGGNAISQGIAKAFNISFDQAEKTKTDSGFLITETHLKDQKAHGSITAEQKEFADIISDSMKPIVREIRQTLMSFRSQYQVTPKAIFITGGGSQLPNIALYLEEILKLPVFHLKYSSNILGQTLQLSEGTEALFSTSMGLALSIVKPERGSSINLRKDEFEKKGGIGQFSLKTFERPLKYMAAGLAFIYANIFIQYLVLSGRNERQDIAVEHAIKNVLGTVSKSSLTSYLNSPTTLKNAVSKEITKYKPAIAAPTKKPISAFDVLNQVSVTIPRDVTLDVSQFSIKDGRFLLKGALNQMTDTDRIIKALQDTKILADVNKGKIEEDSKTKKVKFELSAKVEEPSNGTTR